MKRQSLDTNVLLRLMLQDGEQQARAAKNLVFSGKARFFVSDTAIVEFVFVLERHYSFTREQTAYTVESMLTIKSIDCNSDRIYKTLRLFTENSSLSFEDCYLAASAEDMNADPLWTFDVKLAKKIPAAKLLT